MNQNNIHLACDLESVLAAIKPAFKKEYEKRTGETIYNDYTDWYHSDASFTTSDFFEVTASNWKHRWDKIQPTEPDIAGRVAAIKERVGQLDIVTSREGFDEELQLWLNKHGVPYENFVVSHSVGCKTELDYDVFIDDRPDMADNLGDDQYLLVYDQPYNQDVRERLNVTRVEDLVEACFIVEQKFAVENPA